MTLQRPRSAPGISPAPAGKRSGRCLTAALAQLGLSAPGLLELRSELRFRARQFAGTADGDAMLKAARRAQDAAGCSWAQSARALVLGVGSMSEALAASGAALKSVKRARDLAAHPTPGRSTAWNALAALEADLAAQLRLPAVGAGPPSAAGLPYARMAPLGNPRTSTATWPAAFDAGLEDVIEVGRRLVRTPARCQPVQRSPAGGGPATRYGPAPVGRLRRWCESTTGDGRRVGPHSR
jgi:hypothetical protein